MARAGEVKRGKIIDETAEIGQGQRLLGSIKELGRIIRKLVICRD